jgi:hypothetical protein
MIQGDIINFSKREKFFEIIQEIKYYQSKPYNFTAITSIQNFIDESLKALGNTTDINESYLDLSLKREPDCEESEDEDEESTCHGSVSDLISECNLHKIARNPHVSVGGGTRPASIEHLRPPECRGESARTCFLSVSSPSVILTRVIQRMNSNLYSCSYSRAWRQLTKCLMALWRGSTFRHESISCPTS